MEELTFLDKLVAGVVFGAAFIALMYGLHFIDRGCEVVTSKLFTRKDS